MYLGPRLGLPYRLGKKPGVFAVLYYKYTSVLADSAVVKKEKLFYAEAPLKG